MNHARVLSFEVKVMSVLMFITILVSIQFKVMQATWLHNSAECREVLSDVNREHERQGKKKAIRRRNVDGARQRLETKESHSLAKKRTR